VTANAAAPAMVAIAPPPPSPALAPAPATTDVDSTAPPPDASDADNGGVPDTLSDGVRADILAAVDRANSAWETASRTLDGSVLNGNVADRELSDDLAELNNLRRLGQTRNNVNQAFVVTGVTLDARGLATVRTHETWYADTYTRGGQLLQQTPSTTYDSNATARSMRSFRAGRLAGLLTRRNSPTFWRRAVRRSFSRPFNQSHRPEPQWVDRYAQRNLNLRFVGISSAPAARCCFRSAHHVSIDRPPRSTPR
jgi:hypothetical protein